MYNIDQKNIIFSKKDNYINVLFYYLFLFGSRWHNEITRKNLRYFFLGTFKNKFSVSLYYKLHITLSCVRFYLLTKH